MMSNDEKSLQDPALFCVGCLLYGPPTPDIQIPKLLIVLRRV